MIRYSRPFGFRIMKVVMNLFNSSLKIHPLTNACINLVVRYKLHEYKLHEL